MKTLLLFGVCLLVMGGEVPGAVRSPFEGESVSTPQCQIDKLVFAKLKTLNIQPADLCPDAAFLRRVYLDVIGTVPTETESRAFLDDKSANKRSELIDRLLQRDEFADYWSMKWTDLLRVKAEFPINLWPNAAQAYHRWVHTAIVENMPYDQFVRELLTTNGSNFRVGQVNFYRAVQAKDPKTIAEAAALTFMGSRADKWPKAQLEGMAAFFSQIGFKGTGEWKEEIVFWDPTGAAALSTNVVGNAVTADEKKDPNAIKLQPDKPTMVTMPDGSQFKIMPNRDPREQFAAWLISPKNHWFARNIVNRVWSWLLGRGIIHEPDDIRPDNKPVNPELLAYLEKELVAGRYDLKHIYRLILNSNTYQLSCVPKNKSPEAEENFAQYPIRRIEAEVLIDALNQITGTTEKYSSPVPEPFTFLPDNQRSIALPDGSITSSFLEMFGRPSRDTGLESERTAKPTTDQRLHMLNSSHIQRKIEDSPKLKDFFRNGSKGTDVVKGVYLRVLSRYPTEDEMKTVEEYWTTKEKGRQAALDLVWALMNSTEFLYRH